MLPLAAQRGGSRGGGDSDAENEHDEHVMRRRRTRKFNRMRSSFYLFLSHVGFYDPITQRFTLSGRALLFIVLTVWVVIGISTAVKKPNHDLYGPPVEVKYTSVQGDDQYYDYTNYNSDADDTKSVGSSTENHLSDHDEETKPELDAVRDSSLPTAVPKAVSDQESKENGKHHKSGGGGAQGKQDKDTPDGPSEPAKKAASGPSDVSEETVRHLNAARKSFSAQIDEAKTRVEGIVHSHSKDIPEGKLEAVRAQIHSMAEEWARHYLVMQRLPRTLRNQHRTGWNILARQMYRVASSLYGVLNRKYLHHHKSRIPLLLMNSHQYAPRYWEKAVLRGIKLPKTLIHIGSHADMNHFDRPGSVIRAFDTLAKHVPSTVGGALPSKAETSPSLKLIGEHSTRENAGTLGPALFDMKSVIWIKPKWSGTPTGITLPISSVLVDIESAGVRDDDGDRKPIESKEAIDNRLLCYLYQPQEHHYLQPFVIRAFTSGMFGLFFDDFREYSVTKSGPRPFSTCQHEFQSRTPDDKFALVERREFNLTLATWGTTSMSRAYMKAAQQGKRKLSASDLQTIVDVVKAIPGREFVLDLDLDFFLTSFEFEEAMSDLQLSKTYNEGTLRMCIELVDEAKKFGPPLKTDDPSSHALSVLYIGDAWCQRLLNQHVELVRRSRKTLRTDLSDRLPLQVIHARIDHLMFLLRILKDKHNKIPSVITVSDSTQLLPFHRKKDEHSTSGGDQLPAHFAFYVHERVQTMLEKLYAMGPLHPKTQPKRQGLDAPEPTDSDSGDHSGQ